jgi:hypothetical protein
MVRGARRGLRSTRREYSSGEGWLAMLRKRSKELAPETGLRERIERS